MPLFFTNRGGRRCVMKYYIADVHFGHQNILKFENKQLNTVDLLKEVCNILKYDESEFENLIGDFYTSLNLDKRFIFIENKWDLTENHSVKIIVEDDMDDDIEGYEEENEEEEIEETEDDAVIDDTEALEDLDDDLDDDMEDLTILTEDELEEE